MLDISPRLEERAKDPLYIQLYHYFREEIQSARIPSATRLPSIRKLADYLKVSKTTVEMTYQQLMAEGYIESRERSGFYVVQIEENLLHIHGVAPSVSPKQVVARSEEKRISYHFHASSVDPDHFPFGVWRRLSNQCMNEWQKDLIAYGEHQGESGLREEIARYLRQARGVNCTAEQIVIGAGTQYMIGLLCQMIGLHHKEMAMEDPGYQHVRHVFEHHGFTVAPIPLEEDGIHIHELTESRAKAVYITPSHQYPLGIVMPIGKRLKLLQWAEETGSLIIEDDYDGEFRYRGKPIPSLQGLDTKGNVVYLGTFSKALMPAIRISYMVLPERLLMLYREKFLTYDQTVSRIHQRTLQLFMESGEWERHIRRMRTIYQKKHDVLLHTIKTVMKDRVHVTGQDAGLHIVVEVKSRFNADELMAIAESAGVKVYSTLDKWVKKQQPEGQLPQIMIGFGGLSIDTMVEGIRRLHEAWLPYYDTNAQQTALTSK